MLHSECVVCSRGLKSVIPAWRITAFKDYYDSFMHKQKKEKKNKTKSKNHPTPPFVSFNGLCVNAKQKEVTKRNKAETL